jgi:hypothetical protein
MAALDCFDDRTMCRNEYETILSSARQKVNAHPPKMMTITEMVMWSDSRKPSGRPLYLWCNKAAGERWRYLMFRHLQLMRRALHDVAWGWKPEAVS